MQPLQPLPVWAPAFAGETEIEAESVEGQEARPCGPLHPVPAGSNPRLQRPIVWRQSETFDPNRPLPAGDRAKSIPALAGQGIMGG